jgi:hypothetical protein
MIESLSGSSVGGEIINSVYCIFFATRESG